MERIVEVFNQIRPQDLFDIVLLSAVIYWLLNLIKGTRTIPILVGMTVLVVVYVLASFLKLDAIGYCGKWGQSVPSSGGSHYFLVLDPHDDVRLGGS